MHDNEITATEVLYLILLYEQDRRTQEEMAAAYTVDKAPLPVPLNVYGKMVGQKGDCCQR